MFVCARRLVGGLVSSFAVEEPQKTRKGSEAVFIPLPPRLRRTAHNVRGFQKMVFIGTCNFLYE